MTVGLSVTCSCVIHLVMTVTCSYAYSVNSDWIFYCYTIWHQLKIPEPDLAYCWLVSLSYWSGNTGTPSVSTKKSKSKFITPNVRTIMSNNSINKWGSYQNILECDPVKALDDKYVIVRFFNYFVSGERLRKVLHVPVLC